ncbi:MAG: histidine ammonia-lyase, partial [Bacteroidia bacterium]|nr:histidine ammonia-lyase [Bacteroidia bacterium]
MQVHEINNSHISIAQVCELINSNTELKLSDESTKQIIDCREYLERTIAEHKGAIYGINTGFGSLHNVKVENKDLSILQENLVKSHACGIGPRIPLEIIKLMIFLKVKGLSYGHSGVKIETVQRLVDHYNNDVLPVIYEMGSLGASGDLAPLAHLSLPLIGEGEVYVDGKKQSSKEALGNLSWTKIDLGAKEGLALLNGTQFMSAYGVFVINMAKRLLHQANFIAAMSIDAFQCKSSPFSPHIQNVRPHMGQQKVARKILEHLQGSESFAKEKEHTQDPYSFRCVPQVHGASSDAIHYADQVVVTEINSVTDNPTIFPKEDEIISAGNFHGQPLAIAFDFLAIAMSELGSISERRTYQLISGTRGLPSFLIEDAGLNSGMMIPQYTAASLVSQNKQLCHPASVDSIVSSNGQEDHVSMGSNAAVKMLRVAENLERILAIELLCSAQAMNLRKGEKS